MSRPRKFSTSELTNLINEYTKQYGLRKLKYVELVKFGKQNKMDGLTIDDLRKNKEIREYIEGRNDIVLSEIIQSNSIGELIGFDLDISGIAELCCDHNNSMKVLTKIDSSIQAIKKQYNSLVDIMNDSFNVKSEMDKTINELRKKLEEYKNENISLKHANAALKIEIQKAKRSESQAIQYINRYMIDNIVRSHLIELGAISYENGTGEDALPEKFEDIFIKQGDDIETIIKNCIKSKIKEETSVLNAYDENSEYKQSNENKENKVNIIDINSIKNRIRSI